MINAPISVLLVEDNPADAHLLKRFLSTVDSVELVHVERLDKAIAQLKEKPFDALLLDLYLPDSFGLDTVKKICKAEPELPVLVMTGLDDEEIAIAALREGAQDYLVKGQVYSTWIVRAIHYAIERQQTLDKLQHLNTELARSNDELEQYAHVVSHDLQQPLQAIHGFARLLEMTYRDRPSDEPVNQYAQQITQASQYMSQLINDLLSFSEVGQFKPSTEPTDCNQIIERVLLDLQSTIQQKQANITVDSLPPLKVSETHLSQLFQNLLSNALKYQPPEQAPVVSVSVKPQDKNWLFNIHDNGIGIQTEDTQKIFQIFQRLHSKQDYPGTGIGLAICKKIVESYGGKIWVESGADTGTSLLFTLPTSLGVA